jgi:hypothetical protein
MVALRCPWCDRRLEAADGDILSSAMTVHFHRDHGLVLPDPEQLTGGREGQVSTLAEFEGEMGETEVRRGSEIYGSDTTERGRALYGVRGPPRTVYVQRGEEEPFVECPLCGFEVRGRDEGELSRNLKEHMRENNELEGGRQ